MHTMMERTELKELFEAQADWRTQKAAGHPDDVRNAKAAEILNRLAATVDRGCAAARRCLARHWVSHPARNRNGLCAGFHRVG